MPIKSRPEFAQVHLTREELVILWQSLEIAVSIMRMQIDSNPIRVAKRMRQLQKLRDRMFLIRKDLDQLTKRTR